jgi:hypothetical protein
MMLPATRSSCLKYIHTNISIYVGTGTWYIDTLHDLYPKTSAGNTRHIAASATFIAQTKRYEKRIGNTKNVTKDKLACFQGDKGHGPTSDALNHPPVTYRAHFASGNHISSGPPCHILTNPLNQTPVKCSWCPLIMDDMSSWSSMAAAFHPWLLSTSNSRWEYCIMSAWTPFKIRLLPWTTTNRWCQSISTSKLCRDKGGWMYPPIPYDCHLFFCLFRTTEDQLVNRSSRL